MEDKPEGFSGADDWVRSNLGVDHEATMSILTWGFQARNSSSVCLHADTFTLLKCISLVFAPDFEVNCMPALGWFIQVAQPVSEKSLQTDFSALRNVSLYQSNSPASAPLITSLTPIVAIN